MCVSSLVCMVGVVFVYIDMGFMGILFMLSWMFSIFGHLLF